MLSEEERREYKAKWIQHKRRQMSTKSTGVDVQRQMSTAPSASSSVSSSSSVSEWIKELSTDKAYEGINVQLEYAKAIRWYKERRRTCTRRAFINWLNKSDRNMSNGQFDLKKPAPTGPAYERALIPDPPSEEEQERAREAMREHVGKLKTQWTNKS